MAIGLDVDRGESGNPPGCDKVHYKGVGLVWFEPSPEEDEQRVWKCAGCGQVFSSRIDCGGRSYGPFANHNCRDPQMPFDNVSWPSDG